MPFLHKYTLIISALFVTNTAINNVVVVHGGEIQLEQLQQMLRQNGQDITSAPDLLARMDADQSGGVSVEEFEGYRRMIVSVRSEDFHNYENDMRVLNDRPSSAAAAGSATRSEEKMDRSGYDDEDQSEKEADGRITFPNEIGVPELEIFLQNQGMNPDDAPGLLLQMDVDSSGGVTMQEFRNFEDSMAMKQKLHAAEQNQPPGTIGISQIMSTLHSAGQDPQLAYDILRQMDDDGNGVINEEEYVDNGNILTRAFDIGKPSLLERNREAWEKATLSESLDPSVPPLRFTDGLARCGAGSDPCPSSDMWNDFSLPWQWSPCDRSRSYESKCGPIETECREERSGHFSTHGVGNALMMSYQNIAREIFAKKCVPVLHDVTEPGKEDKYGRPEDNSLFVLQQFVQIPPNIPTNLSPPCVLTALTQPRNAITQSIHHVEQNGGRIHTAPLVGIHIRTGWSDETAASGRKNDASAHWANLDCTSYHTPTSNDNVGYVIRDNVGNNLRSILLNTAAAADRAFGAGQWQVFIASDAPAVKRYAQELLGGRVLGRAVLRNDGLIGHNNGGDKVRTAEENAAVSVSALADLILLSESDMLVYLSSKFPNVAVQRAVCPQRHFELYGYPRHNLASMATLLARLEREGKMDEPVLDEQTRAEFEEVLPVGVEMPCLEAERPAHACACYMKMAHVE